MRLTTLELVGFLVLSYIYRIATSLNITKILFIGLILLCVKTITMIYVFAPEAKILIYGMALLYLIMIVAFILLKPKGEDDERNEPTT